MSRHRGLYSDSKKFMTTHIYGKKNGAIGNKGGEGDVKKLRVIIPNTLFSK